MVARAEKTQVNHWLLILSTAAVPLAILAVFIFKWAQQKTDFTKLSNYFVQRQNLVMAYDTMEVSTGFSDLIEKAARDVQLLALLPTTEKAYLEFHKVQLGDYTAFFTEAEPPKQLPLPFYNRELFLNSNGDVVISLTEGKPDHSWKKLNECSPTNLCDVELLKKSLSLPPGSLWYGRLMRYYTPQGEKENEEGAGISVAYRATKGVFLLGIDYRHLRDHLTTPAFPYDSKRNLLDAYNNGNYIYFVDEDKNIIIHPKPWDVFGIDRKTGEGVSPMKTDAGEGKHPINIAAYESGILKDYFRRLLTRSFTQRGVDIFQAPNLSGNPRILSVTPVLVSKGQYEKTGIFGYVVVGCSVEYFEEPKEKLVPYY